MDAVRRERYLSRIRPFIGNRNAKVLTGIRRAGKSTLLEIISDSFGDDCNVVHISMELWKNREYKDPEKIYNMIKGSLVTGKKNCILIDEIQDIKEWESVIRSLIAENCCDIYLTGSNSRLLSGEFATYLGGRINTVDVFTLTFSECLDFERKYIGEPKTEDAFKKFLRIGGFPSIWCRDYRESEADLEVADISNSILMRDVISRYTVKNPDLLKRILNYVCDNIGNLTSINNIYTTLRAEDKGVGKDTVYSYTEYLESAYLFIKVPTY
ncbi:MAG: ATP-binding protein, partial [Methanomassiliicoccaceae archaeon]|nr:ATP-binding protein [Methanomassiliicoccaceae archaeon]